MLFVLCSPSIVAQEILGSHEDRLLKSLALINKAKANNGVFRSSSLNTYHIDPKTQWSRILERQWGQWEIGDATLGFSQAQIMYSYNSNLPSGSYDDGQWKGAGNNLRADLGVEFSWKGLYIALEGSFWFAENRDFELVPTYNSNLEDYHYWNSKGGTIDRPQQFLGKNLARFNPGQSALRYTNKYFTFAISTENLWIGPSRFFPILLSNNAEGFPHIDLGTPGFIPLKIGKVDLGLIDIHSTLGILKESNSFDNNSSNDYNQFFGLTGGYAFPFQKNLTLGINYVRRKNLLDFPNNFWQLFDLSDGGPTPTHVDKIDSLLSMTLEWQFPEVGFSVYGEYGRNDTSIRDALFTRVDHSNGYTLGLQKVFDINSTSLISITGELTDLFQIPYNGANQPPWYRHHDVPQGHTNRGQDLGSPIGPGSDSQILRVDYFNKGAMYSIWFQRILMDKDLLFRLTSNGSKHPYYPYAQLIIGSEYSQRLPTISYFLRLESQVHFNYGWQQKNDIVNIRIEFGLSL